MNTISAQTVEATWKEAKAAQDDHLATIIGQLSDDQPLLMAYLISVGEQLLDDEEQELLFFFGVLLWQMMTKENPALQEMTEEDLASAEKENAELLAYLDKGPDGTFRSEFSRILESYNQPELLNFVVEVVTEALQDEDIRPASYGPMILYLKVVIDGLDGTSPIPSLTN